MAYSLFEVFGVEIEYAVVRQSDLAVTPIVDKLLTTLCGDPNGHPLQGNTEADNELAAHVVEIKCAKPCTSLIDQAQDFQNFVSLVNNNLQPLQAQLMPTGMHPAMQPEKESFLWPHEDKEIYATYDRVFGCRGHGWFNLQSVHLNLPFANDQEFSQLHNAISLILPLLPALAASTPLLEGQPHAWLDTRLFHYVGNQRRLPSIIGGIIPEPIASEQEYRDLILAPMYKEIAPFDPEELLQDEWLNSRAAIARFDRNAIEIRCMDNQEAPVADLAICHAAVSMLKFLIVQNPNLHAIHQSVAPGLLKALFLESAEKGLFAKLPRQYPTAIFGLEPKEYTIGQFLFAVLGRVLPREASLESYVFHPVLAHILERGNLAERIRKSMHKGKSWLEVYRELCLCLEQGRLFYA